MRGLLDTNILIALLDPEQETPDLRGFTGLTISSLSLSEMHMGVAAMASDPTKKALRENELARTRATFGAGIPYDDRCALAFGVLVEEAVRNVLDQDIVVGCLEMSSDVRLEFNVHLR